MINFWYITQFWKIQYQDIANKQLEDSQYCQNNLFETNWKVSNANFVENPVYHLYDS